MIRLLFCGIWVCAVTLGSAYAAISWNSPAIPSTEAGTKPASHGNLRRLPIKSFSIPIIAEGTVQGYVIAQFTYMVDDSSLRQLSVKPDSYLIDEAFRTIYTDASIDFRQMKKQDLPKLEKLIGENVNKRVGLPLVQEVLIEQLSYIPKDKTRGRNMAKDRS